MLQFKNCNILEAISPLILQPHGTVLTKNRAVSSLEIYDNKTAKLKAETTISLGVIFQLHKAF